MQAAGNLRFDFGTLASNKGVINLADNLIVNAVAGNTSSVGAIRFFANFTGAGNITFNNGNNDPFAGAIAFQSSSQNTASSGDYYVAKGAVNLWSTTANNNFRPGGTVYLGSTDGGNASLNFASTSQALITNNFVLNAGSGGTLSIGSAASSTTILQRVEGNITLNDSLTIRSANIGSNTATADGLRIGGTGGIISGVGGVTITGATTSAVSGTLAGNVSFLEANTFTGDTRVVLGNLRLGTALALQNSTVDLATGDADLAGLAHMQAYAREGGRAASGKDR